MLRLQQQLPGYLDAKQWHVSYHSAVTVRYCGNSYTGRCVFNTMASGHHVLRNVVLFLIFYIFIQSHLSHNTDEIGLSISDDHACSFYIANDQITSTFKEIQPAMPRRSTSIGSRSTSTSKRLQITIIFVKHALLAVLATYCLAATLYLILVLMAQLHALLFKA